MSANKQPPTGRRGALDNGLGRRARGAIGALRRSRGSPPADAGPAPLDLQTAATVPVETALGRLGCTPEGLSSEEARARLEQVGPNALRSHGARPLQVLGRQLHNPLLILLATAAVVSYFTGEQTDAAIILAIIALSVGLGFINEYRSERAVQALHSQLRHTALTLRDGQARPIDVTELVPGDVVRLAVGDVVPADLRLIEAEGLECDESVLTGESQPAEKQLTPVVNPESPVALDACAFMGTIVQSGSGAGVVVQTGAGTQFGKIAMQLGERQPVTAFQLGLRDFSLMLVRITAVLAGSILVLNILLGRPAITSILFALSIAVGLTPQLLPAIVTVSLSTGARRLAQRKVIVKRLVSIEDLGNIDVFFSDKTGTLTEGHITFAAALDPAGHEDDEVLREGLLCNDAVLSDGQVVGGNQLDRALWESPRARDVAARGARSLASLPFDYERKLGTVLVERPEGREVIVKGAPEMVLSLCSDVGPEPRALLQRLFSEGSRVVAVARRPADGKTELTEQDEHDLRLSGFLTLVDRPKADAAQALRKLRRLGVEMKVITGDNGLVAEKVCRDLGLKVLGTMSGADLDRLDDDQLRQRLANTTVFARVSPEQKSRVIKQQRKLGNTVGFLGDGVNDAVALHDADAGVSVQTATDVAKDAADIVLLDKDLAILAEGIGEGRRIFANTTKYVLMGTSSNFGNMFSAAGASLILSFLPMLPSQILLNNLLYDISEMTIPTDNVDGEQLQRPAHWDTHFIRRFMALFGPISSLFDFATFGIMVWVFSAGPALFRSGWFVESLSTQSLVIFLIRTKRMPFFRSRASKPLTISTLACVAVGAILPFTSFGHQLGFRPLPAAFFGFLIGMIVLYLLLVEIGKHYFYKVEAAAPPLVRPPHWRLLKRASRWSTEKRHVPGAKRGRPRPRSAPGAPAAVATGSSAAQSPPATLPVRRR